MRFIRNWLLPTIFAGLGAVLAVFVMGQPGFKMVQTIDGSPVVGGYIRPEDVGTIINQGKRMGSYIDFYGVPFYGEPIYWMVGFISLLAFIGYRIGSRFRVIAPPSNSGV